MTMTSERVEMQLEASLNEVQMILDRLSMIRTTRYVVGYFEIRAAVVEDALTYAPVPKTFEFKKACEIRRDIRRNGRCPIVYKEVEWLILFQKDLTEEIKNAKSIKQNRYGNR